MRNITEGALAVVDASNVIIFAQAWLNALSSTHLS